MLKASQRLGLLFQLHSELPRLVLRNLYTIGIRSVLEYVSVVWAGLSKSDHCRLERINRRAARLIIINILLLFLRHPIANKTNMKGGGS